MLKIGDKVWESGGFCDSEKLVTLKSEFEVSLAEKFWNRLYFQNWEDAERATRIAHGGYGAYLNNALSGGVI